MTFGGHNISEVAPHREEEVEFMSLPFKEVISVLGPFSNVTLDTGVELEGVNESKRSLSDRDEPLMSWLLVLDVGTFVISEIRKNKQTIIIELINELF